MSPIGIILPKIPSDNSFSGPSNPVLLAHLRLYSAPISDTGLILGGGAPPHTPPGGLRPPGPPVLGVSPPDPRGGNYVPPSTPLLFSFFFTETFKKVSQNSVRWCFAPHSSAFELPSFFGELSGRRARIGSGPLRGPSPMLANHMAFYG